jgi:hypothetical protein
MVVEELLQIQQKRRSPPVIAWKKEGNTKNGIEDTFSAIHFMTGYYGEELNIFKCTR